MIAQARSRARRRRARHRHGAGLHPGAGREELLRVFELAARRKALAFIHMRSAGEVEPGGSIDALQEVLANVAATGASVHIVHIGSMGLRQTPRLLAMIDGARARGLDVTTEVYPYTAASTYLQSAMFDPGWQERFAIGFKDVQWAATGERLTEESFARYRKQGGLVVIHMIPEESVRAALAHPRVMVGSDGVPLTNGGGHPRGVGTYARMLGRYVREQKVLDLMTALRKISGDGGAAAGAVRAGDAQKGTAGGGRRRRYDGVRCRARDRSRDLRKAGAVLRRHPPRPRRRHVRRQRRAAGAQCHAGPSDLATDADIEAVSEATPFGGEVCPNASVRARRETNGAEATQAPCGFGVHRVGA